MITTTGHLNRSGILTVLKRFVVNSYVRDCSLRVFSQLLFLGDRQIKHIRSLTLTGLLVFETVECPRPTTRTITKKPTLC